MAYFNNLPHMLKVLHDINIKTIHVGVPQGKDNGFLNMVALVQEQGCHIKAKNYPYLWIPTANANGKRPGEIAGLYVRGHSAGVNVAGTYKVCFVLKKSVDIPARPFLKLTVQKRLVKWQRLATLNAFKAGTGKIQLTDYYKIVGTHMVNDVKDEMKHLMTPPNVPLTINTKKHHENNPLIDTGKLMQSITFFAI